MTDDSEVILEVILQAPPVDESAQAEVAEDIMTCCIVDVVLQAVAVFENLLMKEIGQLRFPFAVGSIRTRLHRLQ